MLSKIKIKIIPSNLILALYLLYPTQLLSEMTSRWEIIEVGQKSIFFIDRESIVVNEDVGRIWQLQDYRDVMRLPPQSISTQMDYNCSTSKNRIFVQYHHTGVMSKGRLSVANIEGKDDWTPIKKNSKEARIFRIICEKDPLINAIPKPTKAVNTESKKNVGTKDEVITDGKKKADLSN